MRVCALILLLLLPFILALKAFGTEVILDIYDDIIYDEINSYDLTGRENECYCPEDEYYPFTY